MTTILNKMQLMNNHEHTTTWPPTFTLKKSALTRHVKLKASAKYGLELCVPMRFNQKLIPSILEANKPWIEKQLAKIQAELAALDAQALPTELYLPALNKRWNIVYIKSDTQKLRLIKRSDHELVLFGNTEAKTLSKNLLNAWVKKQAKIYLTQRITALSIQTGLDFSTVTVRGQRSRWGSCSSKKAINLNYKLLYLPTNLIDHIIIHELCHTIHMNHSGKFWRLVSSFDAQWKTHCREIRHADKHIPLWAQ